MDSNSLTAELERFNAALRDHRQHVDSVFEKQREERHAANNQQHTLFGTMSIAITAVRNQNDQQSAQIQLLTTMVQQHGEAMRRIEEHTNGTLRRVEDKVGKIHTRVAGDEELGQPGLVQEQAATRAALSALTVTVEKNKSEDEERHKKIDSKVNWVIGGFFTLTAVGGILTFAKSIWEWFTHGPTK